MELFYAFRNFIILVTALAIGLNTASNILQQTLGYEFLKYTSSLWTCFTWVGLAVTMYNTVLYPKLFDPLRVFPSVTIHDFRPMLPITDVPRGDLALGWVKQYPGQDAIRVHVGILSRALVPISTAAYRDILSTHEKDFEKPMSGRNYMSRILGYGLILSEGEVHDRQRKSLLPSFRIQNIRSLHNLMLEKTNLMLRRMEEEVEKCGKVDMTEWGSKVTLDIIGPTLMAKDFNSLEEDHQPVHDAFARLTAASTTQTVLFALGMLLPKAIISRIPVRKNWAANRDVGTVRKTCEASLEKAFPKNGKSEASGARDNSDILSHIVSDPNTSRTETVDQMITFLGAGHETTATTIAWITHLLTLPEHKKYQQLIRREVADHPDCTSSPKELESLPWLNSVCEETLRLFPAVTTTARKAIRDTTIAGVRLPKDTVLVLFPWAVNRNPHYWGGADAERFIPERWIDKLPDNRLRLNKHGGAESNFCEMTFLHGQRSCIGRDFAKAELRCIVARLFSDFDVARLPGDDGKVTPAGAITIKPAGGLFVTLSRATTVDV